MFYRGGEEWRSHWWCLTRPPLRLSISRVCRLTKILLQIIGFFQKMQIINFLSRRPTQPRGCFSQWITPADCESPFTQRWCWSIRVNEPRLPFIFVLVFSSVAMFDPPSCPPASVAPGLKPLASPLALGYESWPVWPVRNVARHVWIYHSLFRTPPSHLTEQFCVLYYFSAGCNKLFGISLGNT